MRRRLLTSLVVSLVISPLSVIAASWSGARSPHDAAHLVVVKPAGFRSDDQKPVAVVSEKKACFEDTAIKIDRTVTATVTVRQPGEYRLWVRVKANLPKPSPLDVTLLAGAQELLRGAANEGAGSVAIGGKAAYESYAKLARATGVSGSSEKAAGVDLDAADDKAAELAGEIKDDLAAELDAEAGTAPKENWIHDARLEELADEGPFYWWQIGKVKLEPGGYRLQFAPRGQVTAQSATLVDVSTLR